jgi:membrane protein
MKRVLDLIRASGRLIRAGGRGLWRVIVAFQEHHGLDRAAALAFWALLSFLPFLLMFAGLFGLLVDLIGGANPSALLEEVVSGLRRVFPGLDASILRTLEALVTEHGTLSAAGIPLFLLTSLGFYATLENSFGRIFHPSESRTLARSKVVALAFLLLLLAALLCGALAWILLARLADFPGTLEELVLRSPAASLTLGVVVCAAVFVVLVRWFALVPIPIRLLAAGGLLFGLLWLAARLLFSVYLDTLARYDVVYGSFAALAVVLVWSYYSAAIFLFAAESVQVWRSRSRRAGERRDAR